MVSYERFCPGWLPTSILLVQTSQLAKITGVNHHHQLFGSTGVWTQGFMHARKALWDLSHSPSPFCLIILEIGSYFVHSPSWTMFLLYICFPHNWDDTYKPPYAWLYLQCFKKFIQQISKFIQHSELPHRSILSLIFLSLKLNKFIYLEIWWRRRQKRS
jgi:hypothetical protein